MASRNTHPPAFGTLIGALLALVLGVTPVFSAPPAPGSTHTFLDPVFRGTIFCDELKAVRSIAAAAVPDDIYANYYLTTNARDEPSCMAIAPTGLVVEVIPIGVMVQHGLYFNAWAIETRVDGVKVFALYLERFERVSA